MVNNVKRTTNNDDQVGTNGDKLYKQNDVKINLYGFADDHVMKKSLRTTKDNSNKLKTIRDLKTCTSEVKVWMDHNRLKMNKVKTEFIIYGSRQQLKKCVTNNINVTREVVDKTDCIKYLGAWLDATLLLKHHITQKCRIAM